MTDSGVTPIGWLPDSWLTGPCSIVDCHEERCRATEVASLDMLDKSTYCWPKEEGILFSLHQAHRRWIGVASLACYWLIGALHWEEFWGSLGLNCVCPVLWLQSRMGSQIFHVCGILCSRASRFPGLCLASCCNERFECSLKIRTLNFLMRAH